MSTGREVWDWADSFSKAVQRRAKINELSAQIHKVRCGDCYHWMCSRACPREHNVAGMTRGPSWDGFICDKFQEKPSATKLRDERRAQLATLQQDHQS